MTIYLLKMVIKHKAAREKRANDREERVLIQDIFSSSTYFE